MRTLQAQVKLRRLIRAYADAHGRLTSEPRDLRLAGALVDRLLELTVGVEGAWRREVFSGRLEPALAAYVTSSLRTIELVIAGVRQAGADLELLRSDFESAALPLEVFLRGLDSEPALERSA